MARLPSNQLPTLLLCVLLGAAASTVTLPGVAASEVVFSPVEQPTESQCRPYIEKALRQAGAGFGESGEEREEADDWTTVPESESPASPPGHEKSATIPSDESGSVEDVAASTEEQTEILQSTSAERPASEEDLTTSAENYVKEGAEDPRAEDTASEGENAGVDEAAASIEETVGNIEDVTIDADETSAHDAAGLEAAASMDEVSTVSEELVLSGEANADVSETKAASEEELEVQAASAEELEAQAASAEEAEAQAASAEEPEAQAASAEEAEAQTASAEEAEAQAESVEEPEAQEESVEEPEAQAESVEEPEAQAESVEEPEAQAESAEEPEAQSASAEEPEAQSASAEEAEAQSASAEEAEAQSASAEEAEAQSASAEEAEAKSASAEEAEAQTASVEEPETQAASAEEPEAQAASAEEPEAQAASAEEPEAQAASAEEPEAQAASAEEPEAQTVSAEEPEAQTASAEEPEAQAANAEEQGAHAASAEEPEVHAASAEKSEMGEKEEVAAVGEAEVPTEGAVEELSFEDIDIPENLRPRDHLARLLHLDEPSVEQELLQARAAEVALKELKRLYDQAIKPLETLYKYRDLSNRHFGDPEIFSKPLVVFMGPWSGGKSTIINYLIDNEWSNWALRTGAEPSPAYFNLVTWGERPEVVDGTQLAADWTFSGLQKFGQGLLDRLRGLRLNAPLLQQVNIVEIPGILEIRKQVERVFPFNDACQWFIDRADIIFLVYDPAKLDVGPETEAILDQLKGREYQTRILLNKADQVRPEELMRVQGTLIWNISPLMASPEPPVMYSVSLWTRPYEPGSPTRLLLAQERAFLRDLRSAIDRRVENKMASARRFAVRVRNHAKMVDCYLTTYYNHKGFFGNRKAVSDDIIERPQNYHIYEGLSTLTNISRYDLPDPDVYRDFFRLNPLYDFPLLSSTCTYFRGCPINRLDIAIAYDLPELVGKYKKAVDEASAKAPARPDGTS